MHKTIVMVAVLGVFASQPAQADKCGTNKVRIDGLTHYHSPYEITGAAAGYDHDKFVTKPTEIVRTFAAFKASFDAGADDDNCDGTPDALAQPTFVAYEIKAYRKDSNGNFKKPKTWKRADKWYTEASDDLDFVREADGVRKPRLDDSYSGVGTTWNRGHLAMKLHAERISNEAACNTHFFWNAFPQAARMNQGPWLDLEYWTGAAANKFDSVWIVTGPIFAKDQELQWIGDDGEIPVAIPQEAFKIVIRKQDEGQPPAVLAFIYPNTADFKKCATTSTREFGAYDHTPYLKTVAEIEEKTGLTFFNALDSEIRNSVVSAKAEKLWDIEPKFIAINCKP